MTGQNMDMDTLFGQRPKRGHGGTRGDIRPYVRKKNFKAFFSPSRNASITRMCCKLVANALKTLQMHSECIACSGVLEFVFVNKGMSKYIFLFIDASSHLYNRVCPSVGLSFGRSVGRSVRPRVTLS